MNFRRFCCHDSHALAPATRIRHRTGVPHVGTVQVAPVSHTCPSSPYSYAGLTLTKTGGGIASHAMRSKIAANKFCVILAPILISFSRSVVSNQCLTARGRTKRRITAKEFRNTQGAIPFDHRQQHIPPVFRAGLVATPQHGVFQIAMLVEQKKRMLVEAFKVSVASRALLLPVGFTDGSVQIQNEFFQRSSPVDVVDPADGEIHQRRKIAIRAERLRLEAAHLAARSHLLLRQCRTPTDHVA